MARAVDNTPYSVENAGANCQKHGRSRCLQRHGTYLMHKQQSSECSIDGRGGGLNEFQKELVPVVPVPLSAISFTTARGPAKKTAKHHLY